MAITNIHTATGSAYLEGRNEAIKESENNALRQFPNNMAYMGVTLDSESRPVIGYGFDLLSNISLLDWLEGNITINDPTYTTDAAAIDRARTILNNRDITNVQKMAQINAVFRYFDKKLFAIICKYKLINFSY